jgi:hypothetical protein
MKNPIRTFIANSPTNTADRPWAKPGNIGEGLGGDMGLDFRRHEDPDDQWTVYTDKSKPVAYLRLNSTGNVQRDGEWFLKGAVFVTVESNQMLGSTIKMLHDGIHRLSSGKISVDAKHFSVEYVEPVEEEENWPQVELRPAYVWDCPACGREVFQRGIVPEMAPEESEELRDEFGIQPYEEGDWVLMPEEVTCIHCKRTFPTLHFGEE